MPDYPGLFSYQISDNLASEGHQGQFRQLELLQPKGDAHNRHAEQGAYDNRFNGKGQA